MKISPELNKSISWWIDRANKLEQRVRELEAIDLEHQRINGLLRIELEGYRKTRPSGEEYYRLG